MNSLSGFVAVLISPAWNCQSDFQQSCQIETAPENFIILSSDEAVSAEMGTKEVGRSLQATSTVHFNAKQDVQTAELIITGFCDINIAVPILIRSRYFQLDLETNQKSLSAPFRNTPVPTSFKGIIFLYSFGVLSSSVKREDSNILQVYTTATVVGPCFQLLCKAWRLLFKKRGWRRLSNMSAPYM